jgi:hypothetical protein
MFDLVIIHSCYSIDLGLLYATSRGQAALLDLLNAFWHLKAIHSGHVYVCQDQLIWGLALSDPALHIPDTFIGWVCAIALQVEEFLDQELKWIYVEWVVIHYEYVDTFVFGRHLMKTFLSLFCKELTS